MADTGIFATTAEVQYMAGANCSTVSNTETYINSFMTQAESYINSVTRYNWSDNYSGLNVDVKGILKRCAAALAAMDVIKYDLNSIGRQEAQARLDVLYDESQKCLQLLSDQNYRKFIKAA